MNNTDLKFFTNEPERDLYSRFAAILKSNTQFFDVLVGYFRASGFFKMYEALENIEKIRILVGLNVDRFTVKIIDRATNEAKVAAISVADGKEIIAGEVEKEFESATSSAEVEKGVRIFLDWLKSGKLEMRMFTDAPISPYLQSAIARNWHSLSDLNEYSDLVLSGCFDTYIFRDKLTVTFRVRTKDEINVLDLSNFVLCAAKLLSEDHPENVHVKTTLHSPGDIILQIADFFQQNPLLLPICYMAIFGGKVPQDVRGSILDTYVLEFLDLPEQYSERNLRKAITGNLKQFILEFGKDFTFIGEEYRVQVGGQDFYIDLLFYNRALSCLVPIELKIGKFKPEHIGQINFYLEALDRDVKKPNENPSVGVILCAGKDDAVVEYALSRSMSPTLVSDYTLHLPDKKLLQNKLRELTELALESGEGDEE